MFKHWMEGSADRDDGKTREGVPGFTVVYFVRLGPCMVCREKGTHENQIEFFFFFCNSPFDPTCSVRDQCQSLRVSERA